MIQKKLCKNTNSLWEQLASLVFPKSCICCDKKIYSDADICLKCIVELPYVYSSSLVDSSIAQRLSGDLFINRGYSLFTFKKHSMVQKIIFSIKYSGNCPLAFELGRAIGKVIKKDSSNIDLIVPIPLHKKKHISRGYNQSDCIAEGISFETGLVVESDLVRRKVNTESQTKKSREDRKKNVADVFEINEGSMQKLPGKNILLVDDVVTTGSTIISCAKTLYKSGINSLDIGVLAVTV